MAKLPEQPPSSEHLDLNGNLVGNKLTNISAISAGDPIALPPNLTPFMMKEKTLKEGILSSGAPT